MNGGGDDILTTRDGRPLLSVTVSAVTWLSDHTFEIRFRRPKGFAFVPGQKIGVVHRGACRDYSLAGSPDDTELPLCVRLIPNGTLSPALARAEVGDRFHITAAFGLFIYQPGGQPAVFVATGTGIAPFAAFAHAGARHFHLLHGVRSAADLYYRDLLSARANHYTPCISAPETRRPTAPKVHHGRVTDYLQHRMASGQYDFYLCGRGEMLRDAIRIIDRRFTGSRVFSELFF